MDEDPLDASERGPVMPLRADDKKPKAKPKAFAKARAKADAKRGGRTEAKRPRRQEEEEEPELRATARTVRLSTLVEE